MIYGPNGDVVSGIDGGVMTKKLLQLCAGKLALDFAKESKLSQIMMINDLRKSCGVEPKGGKTITFRRYGGRDV